MSDLISRSQLINALKVHFDSCFREDGELLYSDHICTSDDVVDLIKLVENQPIAYDIDNVVEELEEMKTIKGSMKTVTCRKWDYGTVNRAIEIVKHGSVSDDVCEAKQGKWIFDKFTAKYGNPYRCSCCNEEFGDTYNYCPNCGVSMN